MIVLLIIFIAFCLFMAFYTASLNKKAKQQGNSSAQSNNDSANTDLNNNNGNPKQSSGDKKFGIIVFVVTFVAFIGIAVLGAVNEWGFWPTFIASVIVIVILLVIFGSIKGSECPKCGKKLAFREISRNTVGSYATTIDVERQVRNSKGEVVRRYQEAVPATRYVYDCVDECRFCGYQREVQRENTTRD